jgi:hypothetical protein
MSHGVTEATADLAYFGDSGGLNEATSDIFGTMVEFSANNSSDPGDYLIGEKININGDGTPLRYMDMPAKDGKSQNCWTTNTASLNPHYSSGPLNHWFYLASEGTGSKVIGGVTHNSSACDGSTITGLGRDVVSKIWYRTLTTKLTTGSRYPDAAEGAIKSARELYGANSKECRTIEAAFIGIWVPTGAASCDNLIQNPSFEQGPASWGGTPGVISNAIQQPAHTGTRKAWLMGNGATGTENITQPVAVLTGYPKATLSYWLRINTAETSPTTVHDTLKVQILDGGTTTTLATYSNLNKNTGYVVKTHDVSKFKGKTVTVRFVGTEDSSAQTSFIIDDVALVMAN